MTEKPILFSGEMVKAILSGAKSQTRRVIKPQPQAEYLTVMPDSQLVGILPDGAHISTKPYAASRKGWMMCPYGRPGTQLWVRETWAKWDGGLAYLANTLNRDGKEDEDSKRCRLDYGVKWRPSIFMPREFSRITLEVTGVRVERVQEISEQDTAAEGVEVGSDYWDKHFRALWDSINGKKYPWVSNPWVWAISFKRTTP